MIREGLSEKRILLTGATGFLGTALFERLLVDIPAARLDLVVRGDGASRIDRLLSGSAFTPARERMGLGALEELVARKVRVVAADLSQGPPEVAEDVDLVIHTAASVSFDSPVDDAFRTNLMGTVGLYRAAGGRPFLHVSTAYVAGSTRGFQPEELLVRKVSWGVEVEAVERVAGEVEADSRRPELLKRLKAKAHSELRRLGPQAVARRCEELRRDWVRKRLVEYGAARARSLGWPDVYTFTKGLTEIALDELAGDHPLTIVRPSIIESALEHPYPGWIEGFRMAEPIILAFGRGTLLEFPGIPEGIMDIIPVDLVVNALLAAAATPPQRRSVLHVCSGARNPLRYRDLYDHTRAYFLEHPLPQRNRGGYRVPTWTFPGQAAVDRKLQVGERLLGAAERVVGWLPRNDFARGAGRGVDRLRRQLDFIKRYAGLYGPYVEIEAIYTDDRAKALYESLPVEDRRDFAFDPTAFDWPHYLNDVHLPKITEPVRWLSTGRPDPKVELARPAAGNRVVLAVFDIEGTILAANVIEPYLWLRVAETGGPGRMKEVAALAARGPGFWKTERRDRGEFLRRFYRLYEGASAEGMRSLAAEVLPHLMLRRLAPGAVRRIREHRAHGHRVIFITGSLDFVVGSVAPLADELVAAVLAEAEGRFTGDLNIPPLVGEARASWLTEYAKEQGADLASSYAYADSSSDLPMLQAVGRPVVVNPEVSLARIARSRRWPVEDWIPGPGTPKVLIPANVADR
ncbi:MAG: HAD-IB family hydrolase [Actinomycetota bacterium]